MFSALVKLAVLATVAFAVPAPELKRASPPFNLPGDPAFTVPEANLTAAIDCPNGNTASKTVLLVPGTGEPTVEFFSPNFGALLPANGFNVCFLVIPSLSLGDAQVTAEFVVFGINSLAQTTGGPIRVLSHSQGGLNVQWALTFFPSTRANVQSFFAIAPDYLGTDLASIANSLSKLLHDGDAVASVLQQATGSNFVTALANHSGLTAFVPTNDIRSTTDDVVQPETGANPSSNLAGNAVNLAVQDLCSNRTDDHFELVTDVISQFFALQAFMSSDGLSDPSGTSAADIADLCANVLPEFTSVNVSLSSAAEQTSITDSLITGTPGSLVAAEPPLMAYAQ